jgi:hypothetical protein
VFIFITGTRLKAADYGCLCVKVRPCAAKWKLIAQSLRFTHNEISAIEANPRNVQPNSYLDNVVGVWLEWAPGDARGSEDYATLEQLQIAVNKAGYGAIASELIKGNYRVLHPSIGCTP